ncbi:MAG TPA: hypothetical protein VNM69_17045 [Bacillus sp. (in: firmicutes)]|uniref:hypothetical protein n=1 Tax=Bacillus litorisediminis TaxID=2922713 RepID=UPI001FAD4DD8|nr:hypothetical protein [Bacillus litorisediminis]HWO77575.1 hypothetical protein [Bacillus sp. (in: firmicutes)]
MKGNNRVEEELLLSLRNRPGIEPDPQFVDDLRHRLGKGERTLQKRSYIPFRVVVSMNAVVAILLVLSLHYLGNMQQATPETPDTTLPSETGIQNLLDSNSAYKELYLGVAKVTGMPEQAKKLILYLDAVIHNKPEVLKNILYQSDNEMIDQVLKQYENIESATIELISIQPDVNKDRFEVIFSYQLGELQQVKNLYLRVGDDEELKIEEPLTILWDDQSEEFSLTEQERNAYERFRLEQNIENLKGLSPISIAKLYIQAGLDEDYLTEYALYTTRPERVQWSLEEHLEYSQEPLTEAQKAEIINLYKNIDEGEFIQTGENQGYILFMGDQGEMGFQMVKDESGVWKVSFMPIQ